MSSGAARQNDQTQNSNTESSRADFDPTRSVLLRRVSSQQQSTPTGTAFVAPRVGALLVEAYGKAVRKQLIFSPHQVQEQFIRFLIDSVGKDYSANTASQALELRDIVGNATPETIRTWSPSAKQAISIVLNKHSALIDDQARITSLQERLRAEVTQLTNTSTIEMSSNNLSSGFHNNLHPVLSENNLAAILSDVGPSCTRSPATLREILQDVSMTNGQMNEASLALLIYFFSDKANATTGDQQNALMSSALLSSILSGRGGHDVAASSNGGWNLKVVAQVLSEDYANKDWTMVARMWDMPNFRMKDVNQFRTLLDLYRAGATTNPPLSAFTSTWMMGEGQLSVLECIAATPSNLFVVPLNDEEMNDAAVAPPAGDNSAPNVQFWASFQVLQRLLYLSDNPALYRRVRDLFVKCLLSCPEVLLCSLVRFQLSAANAAAQGEPGSDVIVNSGLQIKAELMRELIPLFFRPNGQHRVQNGPAALCRLYAISPSTVTAACFEAWRHTAGDPPHVRYAGIMHIINIARLLPSPTDAVASLLNGNKDAEFSIAVAFVMADNDYLQLKPWLNEKFLSKNTVGAFAVAIVAFLRKNYMTAGPRVGGSGTDGNSKPFVSIENIAISLQLLLVLDPGLLNQNVSGLGTMSYGATLGENIKSLIEACVARFPSLRGVLAVQNRGIGNVGTGVGTTGMGMPPASDDVEEMATAYFQKIYTSEQSIGEVVEMLKRFKSSGNTKENEIFACMVHNLFDEYRFFSKYPEKELRITGILFGALIQEQLVSSITLGIALRYVLEALRKPPSPPGATTSGGKMFKFGMFALEQFKGRLHEWPQYCSHIVQIPHLKEGYADLVAEIESEMAKSQARAAASAGSGPVPTPAIDASVSSTSREVQIVPDLPVEIETVRVAEFGPKLGRAVNDVADADKEFEAPPDAVLDRVQFLVNNLAPSNIEQKAKELKDMLEPKYFGWLGHFLVVKRISTQANFHSLYLSFLDNLGEYGKGLTEAILNSVYHNIGKLLRSPKITTSSSERSYLKNLGIWLGQITLAKNRPILQIMLDCKELLLQGYETGKLIAVAPFLAKTIEGCKTSIIFRPPNPWVMSILAVFRSVYNVDGLKMNIKFEVEVLCKNLGIKLEDIPLRINILGGRIPAVKDRNPDFNIKPTSVAQKPVASTTGLPSVRAIGSPDAHTLTLPLPSVSEANRLGDQQDTMIPNLASYVTVNPNLTQLLQSQGGAGLAGLTFVVLKKVVPVALDRAIREIIQPVVERSVTIACITTKEIVTKDFAMESDEGKLRKAGQLMVANLAGSLALVTCREPLRSSVSTHLRQLLTSSLGRSDKLGEQEQNVIEQCVQICATDNLELGCMLIEKAATEKAVREIEEALASAVGARRNHRDQTGQPYYDMSIFSNGNRFPASLPDALRPKPGGLKPEHYQLYESFQRLSGHAAASQANSVASVGTGVAPSRTSSSNSLGSSDIDTHTKPIGSHQFGAEVLNALAAKLDSAVTSILSVAGSRAREIKLDMLPADHQIRQLLNAVSKVLPNAGPAGGASRSLTTTEHEVVLTFSQGVFKRLYELSLNEPLRLEALVALLENINIYCPKLGKDMGTWATYAPTNTELQRRLHRTVLLLLVRSRLLSVQDLDMFLAARADSGRNPIWVEFSLLFIRTAFLERIAAPVDFPKLMDLMTKIADGRSQAPPQVVQRYQKPIAGMLDEMRLSHTAPVAASIVEQPPKSLSIEENSSLSRISLTSLTLATTRVAASTEAFARSDSQKARQQVTALLESWVRLQTDSVGSDTTVAHFLQVLQQLGIGKADDQTERFFRLALLTVVDAVLNNASAGDGAQAVLNYTVIDMYSRLLVTIVRHLNTGGSSEQVDKQRLGLLNKILGASVRTMMWHNEHTKATNKGIWDQRPWFRLFMNLLIDLNKPDPVFEPIRLAVLSLFGATFHVCQPLVMPGFAFAWFELVSHRHFLPNALLHPGQKGWNIMHHLFVDHLLFLEPYLRRLELLPPIKKLYEGTLRVFLMLLHDFPSFLAAYHISLCNVIPDNSIQLRNILLSATPKGMSPPDPFTPNLKFDMLAEISQNPVILSNVLGPIESFRSHLDAFLNDGQHRNVLANLLPMLLKDGTAEVDAAKISSLIVYVGAHALAQRQNGQIALSSRTPDMEIIFKLMEFDDRGRYTAINAIANQLRYPSSHTHYFSCVMLYVFGETTNVAVKEQITRILLERLIVNRPHPWGLLCTFIELIKNRQYGFWTYPFTRCATEIEKVFESVARSCMPPGGSRAGIVGGGLDD
ncbi:hypothetical protein MPSEU_000889100 [Mayamaea pseudoterrestris]|nr:hypothetical protein MPSEU_000889100 [Mayamaea pseudoterrestris]